MTQPGRAAIEIVGDASKLGPQLERDAQRAIDNTELDLTSISNQISGGFKDGLADVDADFADAQRKIDEYFASIAEMAEDTGEVIALHFEEGGVRIERSFRRTRKESDDLFDGVTDGAERAGRSLNENLVQPALQGLQRLGRLLSTVGTSLAETAGFSLNPAGLATAAAYIAAFTLLIPLVIGLGAALADLAGFAAILPGALGVAASAIIVTTIAFQGFGDALSAIVDGDPEKIAEALEKLAPSARKVAEEFERVLPTFRKIGDSIQERFFEPLVGILDRLGSKTVPRLRNELDVLATSLGRAVGHFGDLANEAETVGILERLLGSTARITDQLGVAFANLGAALLNALDASLPTLEELSGRLAGAIDSFASFINGSIEDGSFQQFLDDAVATLDELLALGGAIGDLFAVLFSGTDDAGRGFLGTLTDLTQRLTEFFKSAEGQDAIQDFTELIEFGGFVLGQFVTGIRNLLGVFSLIDDAVQATGDFFVDLWQKIVTAWDAIVSGTESAGSSIGDFFVDLWGKITAIWDGIVEGVSSAIDSVLTFFEELPGKIWSFIESIPGLVSDAFNAMVDQAISIFAAGLAAIIVFFTDGPRQIAGAFQALWERAVAIWDGIVATVSSAVTAIGDWWDALPERLAEIGTTIADWATNLWNTIVEKVTSAFNTLSEFVSSIPGRIGTFLQQAYEAVVAKLTAAVEFVKGIPGKIISALGNVGTMLLDSGRKIVQGLINGITEKLGALRQKVVDAVGIIRDHLPFSPAKTGPLSGSGSPQIAGAVIAEMIAAGLDSGQPLIADAAARAASATQSPFGAIGQAGGAPLLSPGGPGAQPGVLTGTQAVVERQPVFIVQIGDEEIEAFIDQRVDSAVAVEVRRLLAGSRGN
jgi:phage-related protein